MKKIGFFGIAEATTLIGDVTPAPALGLEIVRGKLLEPLPQSAVTGFWAVGAGKLLLLADHVMGTGAVEG
jgi:hypothetical protein